MSKVGSSGGSNRSISSNRSNISNNTSISSQRASNQVRSRSTSTVNNNTRSTFENFDAKGAAGAAVGVSLAANQSNNANFRASANSARMFSSRANIAGNAAKGALSAISVPGAVSTAAGDINQAVRTGSAADINQAVQSTASAGTSVVNTVAGGLEAARTGSIYGSAYNAARQAGGTGRVARAAANTATAAALQGTSRQVARNAARSAATAAATTGNRAAQRALGRAVGNAAGTAARRAAGSTLARTAGRFAPGLNVAIAGLDAAQAVAIQADPNSSTAKRAAGWVTAGASAVAASNIPIASQIGAGVSAVSGFLRDMW